MKIAVLKDEKMDYCKEAPFHPGNDYPEYPFNDFTAQNTAYEGVRKLFFMMGLDKENYGKVSWNPLGETIKPGDSVVIKPNLVIETNPVGGMECTITQGPIIRAVLDYVYIALKNKGSITIGDAPIQNADFEKLVSITGLDTIASYYDKNSDIKVSIVDLRKEKGRITRTGGRKKEELTGDPLGYSIIDLKDDSELFEISKDSHRFRVSEYDKNEMIKHHDENKNEYCISNTILKADVIINLPKLKTHGKTGMTCSLKNFVGINGHKDWLPHYRAGSNEEGGDEYIHRDLRKSLYKRLQEEMICTPNMFFSMPMRMANVLIDLSSKILPYSDVHLHGMCYVNDTLPRTISDLNKIAIYSDKNGVMQNTPQRKTFIVVDGIVSGEKDGPVKPCPKKCGILVAGQNPVEVDIVCSRIMGFDYKKIPMFKYAIGSKRYRLFGKPDDIKVILYNDRSVNDHYLSFNCDFEPPTGWKGHIEYDGDSIVKEGSMPEGKYGRAMDQSKENKKETLIE
ncbi:hypothetical protein CUJ83_07605 [Methanocella sp. CWC-04]|uniref:DUF362 domain-containing protein n=1 Tax=Methanooceanicella nereidis TaxID=2052831 RepID=A0AAP2RD12_9EURY|nr:DUF362 domain-containing protein [Methanocella sp. CWC-04]MCD1294862.1 hypothetical protein [Methanocella sp. CWC-04]